MLAGSTSSFRGFGLILMCVLLAPCSADEATTVPQTSPVPAIPGPVASILDLDSYAPQQEVEGEVFFSGSQTLQQVAVIWSDSFRELHPRVALNIDCQGSETALPVIPDQRRSIGLMSRPLTSEERRDLEQKTGCRAAQLLICHDAMGIIVHMSNPVTGFSASPDSAILTKIGTTEVASTWADLNVEGPLGSQRIHVFGPMRTSGTRRYLEHRLLGAEAGSRSIEECLTRDALIQAVSQDPAGVSLLSLSQGEPTETRVVPVAGADGALMSPTEENLLSRRYPVIRPLYLIVAMSGDSLEDPLMRELMSYLLSRSGQEDVMKDGFLPLTRGEAVAQKETLGWNEGR